MDQPQATCSTAGCAKPVHARRMCKAHYSKWYRTARPETVRTYNLSRRAKNRPCCQRDGCTNRLSSRNQTGRCLDHRQIPPKPRKCDQCGATFLGTTVRKVCDACLACVDCGAIVKHAHWGSDRRCPSCLARRRAVLKLGATMTSLRRAVQRSLLADEREAKRRAERAERHCLHCGATYQPRVLHQKFCGPKCKRCVVSASAKLRRQKRGRDAFREPVYRKRIGDRDRWRCGICGKRINPNLKHPHPLSFSLDHIVALAAGGTHEPSNVQAAHLLCNSLKGDRGEPQLLLFG